ncbi:MAG TPA: substrate-binding protein [Ureibacillus sp.]|nr:substrate-binding protein [Ureibacillus sp.]
MKKFVKQLFILSLVLILGACSSSTSGGNDSSSEDSEDAIKVGLITAFSGAAAVYGPPVKNSAQLAINEINEAGGLLGKELVLFEADTATDPKTASDQAKALSNNKKVDALFAEVTSAERNAVLPVIEKSGQLFFYNAIYEGGEFSESMFINGEVPNQQISPVYPYIMKEFKGSKWFIIGEDYVWPKKTSEAVHKAVEEADGEVVGEEYVPLGNSEYSSILTKIKSAKPDFISLQTNGPAAVAFMKQFKSMGLDKSTKVVALAVDENSISAMGDAAEGLLLSAAYFTDMDTPENNKFKESYFNAFGEDAPKPNFITVPTYDAIHQWAKAVEAANSLDPDKVKEQLSKVTFTGPRGEVVYDQKSQHAKLPIYLAEAQSDGTVKIINEFGSVEP